MRNTHPWIMTSFGPVSPEFAIKMIIDGVRPADELIQIFDQLYAYFSDLAVKARQEILAAARKYPPLFIKHVKFIFSKVTKAIKTISAVSSTRSTYFRNVLQKILRAKMPAEVFITFSSNTLPSMKLLKKNSILKFSGNDLFSIMEAMATGAWGKITRTYKATILIINRSQIVEYVRILSDRVVMIKILEPQLSAAN